MSDATLTGEIFKIDEAQRRVFGWAHIVRKADGTLPRDSQGDVVDTDEAVKAWEDAWYEFLPAAATADDMHVDFDVAKIEGGLVFTPDLTKSLGIPDGILPTGAFIVVRIPKSERGDALWADVTTGKRKMFSIVASVVREDIP